MRYELIIKPTAERSLDRLSQTIRRCIVDALEELRSEPRPAGCLKMAGDENAWRIRVGDYRIVYEIHDGRLLVLVVRVGHRKDVYRKGK